MARNITALGGLGTGTVTRSGRVGDSDLFNLAGRAQQLRSTDWYTFSLPTTANSLVIRSTGGSDMVGGLFVGTIGPMSLYADLGAPLAFDDDSGLSSNFQISRTNQGRGTYTVAVQRFASGPANYTLEIVAVVSALQTRDAAFAAETGLPTVSLVAERVAATPPARPARPTARIDSLTSLFVSWIAPDDGGPPITAYAVRYRAGTSGPWTAWAFAGTGTSTTITGLELRTNYQVQVRAQNRIGASSYSLSAAGTTIPAPAVPDRPAVPAVRGASTSSLNVSWVAPYAEGAPITDYDVQYRAGTAGSWTTWPHMGIGTTTTITGLKSGTGYQVRVRAESSIGESQWSLPGAADTEAIMATLALEIDWGNDGTFRHAAADVTGDLVKHSLRTTRGRTLQSRRKAVAGRLECKLWNLNAKYDPLNSASPVFGRDISGLRVRAKLAGTVIWAGLIDSQRYRHRPVPQLDITALGVLSTLRQPVSVAVQVSKSVGAVAKLVGAAAGVKTSHLAGDKTLDLWPGVSDQDALGTLHDLEEYEEGFLKERADGDLALEAETARAKDALAVSALTLTDEIVEATDIPLLRGSALDWGFRQIANVVNVPVTPLAPFATVITLWSISTIMVDPGVTLNFHISYPEDNSPLSHRGVSNWIEPVAGTDYTAQSGLIVSGALDGGFYVVSFKNETGTQIAVGDFKLRGTPLVAGESPYIQTKDSASITAFGEREYARPSPLFTDIGKAQKYADGIVRRQAAPHGWLVARWPAYSDVAKAQALDLSRRITLERLGATRDYFIEGISLAQPGFVRMEYLLSPVPGVTAPSAPVVTVEAIAQETKQLAVSWSAPYDGGSMITDYAVRYRVRGDSTWTAWPHTGTARTTTITGLLRGNLPYSVQVRSKNDQGDSLWSHSVTGVTFTYDFDLVPANNSPTDITWDGTYYRVLESSDRKVYAYDSDGVYVPNKDFDLAPPPPTDGTILGSSISGHSAITWDGTYYRVVSRVRLIIGSAPYIINYIEVFAYNSGGRYVSSQGFTLGSSGSGSPIGITWYSPVYLVLDWTDRKVYAYGRSGGRVSSRDFDLTSGNSSPRGITRALGYTRVVDGDRTVYAYDSSGDHVPSQDFTLTSDNSSPTGITWDGTEYRVLDSGDDKVYTYNRSGVYVE